MQFEVSTCFQELKTPVKDFFKTPIAINPISPGNTTPSKPTIRLLKFRLIAKSLGLDLCILNFNFFMRNFKRSKGNRYRSDEGYIFSIMILDRFITNSLARDDKEIIDQIKAKLPEVYVNFADIFSKHNNN